MTGSMAVTGRLDDDVVRERVRGHPDQPEKQQESRQTQTTPPQHESIVDGQAPPDNGVLLVLGRSAKPFRPAADALGAQTALLRRPCRRRRTPWALDAKCLAQGGSQPLESELAVARLASLVLCDGADDRDHLVRMRAFCRLVSVAEHRRRSSPRPGSRSSGRAGRPARWSATCECRSRPAGSQVLGGRE